MLHNLHIVVALPPNLAKRMVAPKKEQVEVDLIDDIEEPVNL